MTTTDRTATLTFSDGSPAVSFPILTGSIGPEVIDIRTLYGKTGKFTFDPGFIDSIAARFERRLTMSMSVTER